MVKIMVVEDDTNARKLMCAILKKMGLGHLYKKAAFHLYEKK